MISQPNTTVDHSRFLGADLRGADLSCVEGITAEHLRGAIIDKTTLMPPGLEHLVRSVPPAENRS